MGYPFLLRSRFKGKVLDLSRVNHFSVRCVALRRATLGYAGLRHWPPEAPLDNPKVIKNPFIRASGRCDKMSLQRCPHEAAPQDATRHSKAALKPAQHRPKPPLDRLVTPQDRSKLHPLSTSAVLAGAPMEFKIEKHDGGIAQRP